MNVQDDSQRLEDFKSTGNSVLSIYLNTNPADPEQGAGAWKIHLKNEMKTLEQEIEAKNDQEEMKLFTQVKKKALKEIEAKQGDLNKGIVLFASEDPELWSVYYVQVAVKTSFHWSDVPELEQFQYMNKAYPKAGIILPALDMVRILDTSMGVLNEELVYEFDPGSDRWQEKKGVAYGAVRASSAKHVDSHADRLRENLLRFYKEMGTSVEQLKKNRHWEEIHISGEAELAKAFATTLRTNPASILHKNLINSKPNTVLHEVFEK